MFTKACHVVKNYKQNSYYQMCSFKLKMNQTTYSAAAPPRTPHEAGNMSARQAALKIVGRQQIGVGLKQERSFSGVNRPLS